MEPSLLIVSPVRNEAAHIERVVQAVAAQELPPERWLIMDDGSDDGSGDLLRELAHEVPFLTVIDCGASGHAGSVRDRLASAPEARNFNVGTELAGWRDYTHIMKLDGDIELPPEYLRELMARFAADRSLGLAGGVLVEPTPRDGIRRIEIARNHVHGALKCYSRECLEAIGGMQERLGWDTIDETYARMRGFTTYSFPDLVSVHLRPIGSADGTLRGHARHGECAYITHYTPSFIVLRAFKVGRRRPMILSGVAFVYGFLRAAVRRVQRVPDGEYRRFTHRELRGRLVRGARRVAR